MITNRKMKRVAIITIGRGFGGTCFYITRLGETMDTTKTSMIHSTLGSKFDIPCHIPKNKIAEVKQQFANTNYNQQATLEFQMIDYFKGGVTYAKNKRE